MIDISMPLAKLMLTFASILFPAVVCYMFLGDDGFIYGSVIGMIIANSAGMVGEWIWVLIMIILAVILLQNRGGYNG